MIVFDLFSPKVGFNAGDGQTFVSVPDSRTDAIINIAQTSNVNRPGVWIYKVGAHLVVVCLFVCLCYSLLDYDEFWGLYNSPLY